MKVLDYDGLEYYNSLIENIYAPKVSPAFTGTPTAPTPTANDSSTKIATTAYVQAELADYVTLNDLSSDLSDYLPLSGGTMTGGIVLDTPSTNSPIIIKLPQFQYNTYRSIKVVDSSSNDIGSIYISSDNQNQRNSLGLNVVPYGTSSSAQGLQIRAEANGDVYSYVNTPPSGDNSDKIATTSFVNTNYLPLSGGTMTGTLEVSDTDSNVNGYLQAYGWGTLITADSSDFGDAGARLTLNTQNTNSVNNGIALGQFNLEANDGTDSAVLSGAPNGTLTWKGKQVVTCDTRANYILRYKDSGNITQICWGSTAASQSGTTITFPHAFDNSGSYYILASASGYNISAGYGSKTTTGFKLTSSSTSGATVSWIAIGRGADN